MCKTNKTILLANCIFALLLGGILYYILSPEVYFVKQLNDLLSIENPCVILFGNDPALRFLRNHFLDMLWAYALTFAVFLILDSEGCFHWKAFFIAFLFSTAMELLQLTSAFSGTFDPLDIFFEFLAELFAVTIIRKSTVREANT